METLKLAIIMGSLALPLHLALRWQLDRICNPRHIRRVGVALDCEEQLEARSEVIGYYDGCRIYAWVEFLGMRYRFQCVTKPSYRNWVEERELFLHPGLLYITD
jgi:hypothetical protein